MDIFEYLSQYQVLICKPCQYAVPPSHLQGHIQTHHRNVAGFRTKKEIQAAVKIARLDYPLRDPRHEKVDVPPPRTSPLPHLRIRRGLRCVECPYISCQQRSMSIHVNGQHLHLRRRRGQQSILPLEANRTRPRWEATFCQRFFATGIQSSYFSVVPPSHTQDSLTPDQSGPRDVLSPQDLMRAEIERQLDENAKAVENWHERIPNRATATEVSPWLEMTRWPKYLEGYGFTQLATLAERPHPTSEPLLQEFVESLERVIQEGHRSVQEDKVNVFDQARINSFIQRHRASDRPLMVQLAKSTWRKYTSIWQRLICFAYRTVQPRQSIQLRHQMTNGQMASLDQAMQHGEDFLICQAKSLQDREDLGIQKSLKETQSKLDRAILLFCIALLDHTLKGDLFESTVVGFLAVLGIDVKKQILQDACSFTPNLSGLIKIGQVLVIQRSILATEEGEIEHPADLLDEMRERFMIHGSRSPFNWALRLRAYGKKIRNSTTSLGYICWSEDSAKLSYKTTELQVQDFKDFVRTQVQLIQAQLEDLLLLHPDEDKTTIIPTFSLRHLKDQPSKNTRSWSFLVDPRNQQELPNRARWLLNRVLDQDWLRDEFLKVKANGRFH